jgi:hypothetical protein
MNTVQPERPERLSPGQALFLALEDPLTAHFLRTEFEIPEQRPEIVIKRRLIISRRYPSWHVAIIEKPRPLRGGRLPLLNIAHVMVDGLDGRILQRWFLRSVLYAEYREFMRQESSLRKGCRDRSRSPVH